jgi:ferrous iron transport protein A
MVEFIESKHPQKCLHNSRDLSTIATLIKGEIGYISEESLDEIPLKLLEMGCLPGAEVQLIQLAPLKDLLYINVNGTHLAIRKETALIIKVIKES